MILSPNIQFLVYYASVALSVSLLQNFNILKEEISTCLVSGTLTEEDLALARWEANTEWMRLRLTSWCLQRDTAGDWLEVILPQIPVLKYHVILLPFQATVHRLLLQRLIGGTLKHEYVCSSLIYCESKIRRFCPKTPNWTELTCKMENQHWELICLNNSLHRLWNLPWEIQKADRSQTWSVLN